MFALRSPEHTPNVLPERSPEQAANVRREFGFPVPSRTRPVPETHTQPDPLLDIWALNCLNGNDLVSVDVVVASARCAQLWKFPATAVTV